MKPDTKYELGMFEGFNFRADCAIEKTLSADEVINWDHDAQGEAEFWPDGSNPFVSQLLSRGSCSAENVRHVIRIFEELDSDPHQLAKAVYLKDNGSLLEEICREAIDESCLYVFGPGWFSDLRKQAAYELFEQLWPEAYSFWERNDVPGFRFDEDDFMEHFSTFELKLSEGGYLIVDTQ